MRKWEYRTLHQSYLTDPSDEYYDWTWIDESVTEVFARYQPDLADHLSDFGSRGWEFVALIPVNADERGVTNSRAFLLKREIEE